MNLPIFTRGELAKLDKRSLLHICASMVLVAVFFAAKAIGHLAEAIAKLA